LTNARSWSATVKTVEKSNFFLQIPIIWKRFYPQLVFFTIVIAGAVICGTSLIPSGYRMGGVEIWVPLGLVGGSHLLYPLALNPYFLSFSVSQPVPHKAELTDTLQF
jgi:hypothetical protein